MQLFLRLSIKLKMLHRQNFSSSSVGGFTLIELLVVTVMVGTLAAIAAPSWHSFLDRQRMNAARSDLMGVLKNAQDEAQARQQSKQVTFVPATATTPLSVAVRNSFLAASTPSFASSPSTVTILGNGTVGTKFSFVASTPIVFDSKGKVFSVSATGGSTPLPTPYVIKIRNTQSPTPPAGQSPTQSCVIVTTLLGGLKPANDSQCDNFSP